MVQISNYDSMHLPLLSETLSTVVEGGQWLVGQLSYEEERGSSIYQAKVKLFVQ